MGLSSLRAALFSVGFKGTRNGSNNYRFPPRTRNTQMVASGDFWGSRFLGLCNMSTVGSVRPVVRRSMSCESPGRRVFGLARLTGNPGSQVGQSDLEETKG